MQTKQEIESIYLQKLIEIENSNLTTEEKSKVFNKTFGEYQNYKQSLQNLIKKGKYHNITLLKFPEDSPEGDVEVPVRITYTREKNGVETQESVVKTLMVTVTSTIQPRRAIIIDIDALKKDAFENALPNMPYTKVSITDNGVRFTDTKTVFPSITMAAQASIYTGNYPGNHDITGNTWFEKTTETYRDYWLGTWYEDLLYSEGQANEDMSGSVDTIYEAADSAGKTSTVIFNQYSRLGTGTTKWIKPGIDEYGWMYLHEYYKVDHEAMSHALEELNEDLPDILTIYMPGFDANSHYYGPEQQENYLQTYIDNETRRLLFGDDCLISCQKTGIIEIPGETATTLYDETIIVIVADHGQTRVTDMPQAAINSSMIDRILEDAGYVANYWGDPDPYYPYMDFTIAPNGGMEQIYIQNGLTLGDGSQADGTWGSPPMWADVQPAAQALLDSENNPTYGLDEYIDLILVKYQGSNGYEVYTDGGGTVSLSYFNGKESQYPNAIERIQGLDSARSGDILILANYSNADGYMNYFADDSMKGEHGNLNAEDTYVPLVFSGPTMRKGETDSTPARNIDMATTLANILGFSMPNADGVVLPVYDYVCYAQNGGVSALGNKVGALADCTPPSTPSLISPSNGYVTNNPAITFTWTAATDADSGVKDYQIQIDNNNDFSSPNRDLFETGLSYSTTLSDGTYYWRVRARDNSDNLGGWSTPIWSFTVFEKNRGV